MWRDEFADRSYFVYMVRCADGSFYAGVSTNVEKRVWEHNEGVHSDAYTYKRRPVTLVHSSRFGDLMQARRWERQLKGWSRAKKEALIGGDYGVIHVLAQRYSRKIKDT